MAPGNERESHKIAVKVFQRRTVCRPAGRGVAEKFAQSRDLFQPMSVARVAERQIKQFERPPECGLKISPVPSLGRTGTVNFAADVPQLFGKRESEPSACREVLVLHGHTQLTSFAATARIRSLIAGSSMLRERFPRDGRTLIRESNSIQSSPSFAG